MACTSGFMVVLLPDRSSRVETGLTPLYCSRGQSWKAKRNTKLDLGSDVLGPMQNLLPSAGNNFSRVCLCRL